ncbi:hypothetical protein M3Y97_00637000 [Aphelenchoides bicaudatus]|nr:hypothetical protein M3Y97_00637000 [Aphelenchoides bicaudatus]
MRFLSFLLLLTLVVCLNADHKEDVDHKNHERYMHHRHRTHRRAKSKSDHHNHEHNSWITVCKRNISYYEKRCECSSYTGIVDCTFNTQKAGSLKSVNIRLDNSFGFPKKVILSKNSIDVFEQDKLFSGKEDRIEVLELKDTRLSLFEPGALNSFRSLKTLVLTKNFIKLDSEHTEWITEQLGDSLENLYLDNNRLEHLPNEVFDKLIRLETLNLNDNPKLKLSPTTFGRGLSNLKELSLANCNLNSLPNNVFKNLRNLESLSLANNPLNAIPSQLKATYNLQILNLEQTHVGGTLQKDAFINIVKLTHLKLNSLPRLKQIDSCAFCGLSQLRSVDVSESEELTQIDENAFGLAQQFANATHNLKVFHADNCKIFSFSPLLLNWESMELVTIAENPLDCNEMEWLVNDTAISLSNRRYRPPKCHSPVERRGEFVRHYDNSSLNKFQTSASIISLIALVLLAFE